MKKLTNEQFLELKKEIRKRTKYYLNEMGIYSYDLIRIFFFPVELNFSTASGFEVDIKIYEPLDLPTGKFVCINKEREGEVIDLVISDKSLYSADELAKIFPFKY